MQAYPLLFLERTAIEIIKKRFMDEVIGVTQMVTVAETGESREPSVTF